MQRMRLVDDGIELLLSHVADVRLLFVGATAAGSTGLDDVAPCTKIGARELAQLPRPVCALESRMQRGPRQDELEMRTGHIGKAADHQTWARENAGMYAVTHGAHVLREQAARAGET